MAMKELCLGVGPGVRCTGTAELGGLLLLLFLWNILSPLCVPKEIFEQEDQISNLKIGLAEETLKSYLIEKELAEGRLKVVPFQNSYVETKSSI